MAKRARAEVVVQEHIQSRIFLIRGHKVMLDADLSHLYEVPTKVLNQAVKRNKKRFPSDFMFQLSKTEKDELVTNCDRFRPLKHSGTNPYAFTEQGVSMLSSVLNSERAIKVNIQIMRAFIKLRELLETHMDLRRKLHELEMKYDGQFQIVFQAINQLLKKPRDKALTITGFHK